MEATKSCQRDVKKLSESNKNFVQVTMASGNGKCHFVQVAIVIKEALN